MVDSDGAIHQCISEWGWVIAVEKLPKAIWHGDWEGAGHYLRFANYLDQDCDSYRIYYCPVCGERLD